MAKSDKRRIVKHPPNTRGRKPRLVSDVDQSARHLDAQLRSMGLRVVPTEGDGNCLFRALSDQLYGTDRHHATLRREICNWLADHPDRYRGFVDDDRSLEDHIAVMRQLGTYGGHLELSAFAHRFQRDVKVVQTGLVYVISCAAPPSPIKSHPPPLATPAELDEREARRLRREAMRKAAEDAVTGPVQTISAPIYVAYHDWEHYSSLRGIDGPLHGPGMIQDHSVPPISPPQPPTLPRPRGRPRKHPLPPHRIPLPPSPPQSQAYRDPSPSISASTSVPSTGTATEASTPPTSNSPKRSASEMSDDDDMDIDDNPRARKAAKSHQLSSDKLAEVEAVLKKKLSRKDRRAVGRVGGSRRVLVRQKPRAVDRPEPRHRDSPSGDISFKELLI
ncbi:cysteine proteinase [Calocera viscosa TUFC12733]|uniref:Cysteine proteinase n=1 Tax=Calocera viscosa (strain TUFC12733) TaxID=1330018 RepID=A0A167NA05_CALVF|nr:cysteine proteinase [Calocera viscosa TUFC12733]